MRWMDIHLPIKNLYCVLYCKLLHWYQYFLSVDSYVNTQLCIEIFKLNNINSLWQLINHFTQWKIAQVVFWHWVSKCHNQCSSVASVLFFIYWLVLAYGITFFILHLVSIVRISKKYSVWMINKIRKSLWLPEL